MRKLLGNREIGMAQLSTHPKKRQKGQAMLETALVITTLVSMLIFTLDMGRLLLIQQWWGSGPELPPGLPRSTTGPRHRSRIIWCITTPLRPTAEARDIWDY